jgi:hypothetical protein
VSFVIDFNIAPSARLDQNLTANYQILDAYAKKLTTSDIFQTSYYNIEITHTWSKRGQDGIPVPRGRIYYVNRWSPPRGRDHRIPVLYKPCGGPAKKFVLR